MESTLASWTRRLRKATRTSSFWIVAAMLLAIGLLHYATPQMRSLSPRIDIFLNRHAVERIIFLLPVAAAAFAFGKAGGLITLALTLVAMVPRALWLSPYPLDALAETGAMAVVGYLVTWMIETQEKEKTLRQEALSQLRALNAVTAIATRSLELEQVLEGALEKALEVTRLEAGLIFVLDRQTKELSLRAFQGLKTESAAQLDRLEPGEGFCGRVAHSGRLMVVQDSALDPRLTRAAVRQEGLRSQVVAPLRSKGEVQGVMALATRQAREFSEEELELITAIANQIGVALENARLYESMRFYARQIIQAQEGERKRIAQELHDETIQMLIAISRRLEALDALPQRLPESSIESLEQARELTRSAVRGVRRFVQDLRPPTLDHLGLIPALQGLVVDMTEKESVPATLEVQGRERRLTPEEEMALFRIAQEALSNVRRHAQATRATVRVSFGDVGLSLTVEDDGRGFELPAQLGDVVAGGRLGLIGMHERARAVGGTLTIRSRPAEGTTVVVDLPQA